MSYCVNCGVELDKTCEVCPLCNTKVINPKQPVDRLSPKPYPSIKGSSDPVRRSDITILITVIFAVTAIVCGLLNLLFLQYGRWSLYVIGACAVLWVFFLPVFFPSKRNLYINLGLDGLSIAMYLGIIARLHPGMNWYLHLALPITAITTLLILVFAFFLKFLHSSILALAAVIMGEIGILSVSIELLIHWHSRRPPFLSWSAVILTCCIIIDGALITIFSRARLRNEIRRRMHI